MGRAGVKMVAGLRVAYLSGIDFDVLGGSGLTKNTKDKYMGNYFVEGDLQKILEEYNQIVKND